MVKTAVGNIYYGFDTSALITMQHRYPPEMFPSAWQQLERMFQNMQIFSHVLVYDEITQGSKNLDTIGKWVARRKKHFRPITQKQVDNVSLILSKFPNLILAEQEKDQADPWLIALMMEQKENRSDDIFSEYSEAKYFLVSEESPLSPEKIPAVCKHFAVEHMSLLEFFRAEDFFRKKQPNKK